MRPEDEHGAGQAHDGQEEGAPAAEGDERRGRGASEPRPAERQPEKNSFHRLAGPAGERGQLAHRRDGAGDEVPAARPGAGGRGPPRPWSRSRSGRSGRSRRRPGGPWSPPSGARPAVPRCWKAWTRTRPLGLEGPQVAVRGPAQAGQAATAADELGERGPGSRSTRRARPAARPARAVSRPGDEVDQREHGQQRGQPQQRDQPVAGQHGAQPVALGQPVASGPGSGRAGRPRGGRAASGATTTRAPATWARQQRSRSSP